MSISHAKTSSESSQKVVAVCIYTQPD